MAFLVSGRTTTNVTLATYVEPGAYSRSERATSNVNLAQANLPSGWIDISMKQSVSGIWQNANLMTDGQQIRIIQYADTPPVTDPGRFTFSSRVTQNVTLASAQWEKPAIGIIGSNETTFNDIDAQVGPVLVRRTYNTTLPASWAVSNANSDVAAGRKSYWSWKPNVLSFPNDNSARNAFSAFLDTIPADHESVIMAWHEPENDIENGDYTLSQWGALQDAVSTIVKSKNRNELRTGFCLMGPWTFDTRSGRTAWDWEGALNWNLIDVVGIDPYRTVNGSTMSLQTMLTVNNSGSGTGGAAPSMMAKLSSWGKPVSIMEWGAYNSTEASVATFISDGYAWMKSWNQAHIATPIESALWYNHTLIGADTPLTGIEVDAYSAIVADSKVEP